MIILLPGIALLLGALIGLYVMRPVGNDVGIYLAVAFLAGLDSLCGGIRAAQERKFQTDVFVSGFISNVLFCSLLAWIGDKIGVNTYLAVGLVLGQRILINLSLIRRLLLTKWQDWIARRRLERAQQIQAVQVESNG